VSLEVFQCLGPEILNVQVRRLLATYGHSCRPVRGLVRTQYRPPNCYLPVVARLCRLHQQCSGSDVVFVRTSRACSGVNDFDGRRSLRFQSGSPRQVALELNRSARRFIHGEEQGAIGVDVAGLLGLQRTPSPFRDASPPNPSRPHHDLCVGLLIFRFQPRGGLEPVRSAGRRKDTAPPENLARLFVERQ
jgi:hypothetical protein